MIPDITAQFLDRSIYLPAWARLIIMAAGATLSATSAVKWVRWQFTVADACLEAGFVVSVRQVIYGEGDGYLPTVRFKASGKHVEFESTIGSGRSQWSVGDQVWVRIDGPRPTLHVPTLMHAKYLTLVLIGILIASASLADHISLAD